MNRKIYAIMITLLIMVFLNGCSDMTSAKPAAEIAITGFHEMYNSEDFESIFDDSHKDFKAASNFESFSEFMQAVHSKLGRVKSTESQNWKVGNYNLKTSVSLQQKTQFENGSGVETFNYRIEDEKAILVGYNINSRDLIVK